MAEDKRLFEVFGTKSNGDDLSDPRSQFWEDHPGALVFTNDDNNENSIYFGGKQYGVSQSAFVNVRDLLAKIMTMVVNMKSGDKSINVDVNTDTQSINIQLPSTGSSALANSLKNHISGQDGIIVSYQENDTQCNILPDFRVIQKKLVAGEGVTITSSDDSLEETISVHLPGLFKVVSNLPTVGTSLGETPPQEAARYIYLVGPNVGAVNNRYVEYIFKLNDSGEGGLFEKIGELTPEVDLTNYYTKEETDNAIDEARIYIK